MRVKSPYMKTNTHTRFCGSMKKCLMKLAWRVREEVSVGSVG